MQTDPSERDDRGAEARYFVLIFTDSQDALLKLRDYNLDLIEQTAQAREDGTFSVEALITQTQIERIGAGGYTTEVQADAATRARAATEVIEFDEWLRGMEEGEEEG